MSECVVSKDVDYVKIEIFVLVGCFYGLKVFWEICWEMYCEYCCDWVVIYCEKLFVGKYNFNVLLEMRYVGCYYVNFV